MTKKAVRSVDRQLKKLEDRRDQEILACCNPEELLVNLAVLAECVDEIVRGSSFLLKEELDNANRSLRKRSAQLMRIRTRHDTLASAIRSGKFASIDEGWG